MPPRGTTPSSARVLASLQLPTAPRHTKQKSHLERPRLLTRPPLPGPPARATPLVGPSQASAGSILLLQMHSGRDIQTRTHDLELNEQLHDLKSWINEDGVSAALFDTRSPQHRQPTLVLSDLALYSKRSPSCSDEVHHQPADTCAAPSSLPAALTEMQFLKAMIDPGRSLASWWAQPCYKQWEGVGVDRAGNVVSLWAPAPALLPCCLHCSIAGTACPRDG